MAASITRPSKRKRTSTQFADWDTSGTLVVFCEPPVTIAVGGGGPSVELDGRLWEVEVDGDDRSTLVLRATTTSDDSKDALAEVLAARSHEALQREEEAQALGADLERLMARARQVCVVLWCCLCYVSLSLFLAWTVLLLWPV